ncbi:hypothetical protein [Streptomyces sp. AF1A]|jgi:hypothetical protein|uniref:hypothetical protein n=1 Tax=Streptomyces sp. AF1A TaxID=3394350 RepID=UPI0039BD8E7E
MDPGSLAGDLRAAVGSASEWLRRDTKQFQTPGPAAMQAREPVQALRESRIEAEANAL